MGLLGIEKVRRKELETLANLLTDKNGKIELYPNEMRDKILSEFTKQLDAKLKNIQDGEAILATFSIDIVSKNGKIRGGNNSQRNMPEYSEWRSFVFSRDSYTCQECGYTGDKLNAHHIKSWANYPELRFDVKNGITLCEDCHSKKHPHLNFI